jgi:hypothetical protein
MQSQLPAGVGQEGLVEALRTSTAKARAPELTPVEMKTLELLAVGMSYKQTAAVLPNLTPDEVSETVRGMLSRWDIAPPASVADLIVAAHDAGVVRAAPTTLARSSMMKRLREELGVNLEDRLLVADTTAFAAIEGWNQGESREALSKSLNLSQVQMERHVHEWAAHFGLISNEGYETTVARIVAFARERGYLAR